jgi:hypothetical protein
MVVRDFEKYKLKRAEKIAPITVNKEFLVASEWSSIGVR